MEKLGNYILQEKIHETGNSIIYRGHKENESQSFIIKLLKTKYPNPSEIARFRQEYELIKSLELEDVIKTFDIVSNDDGFALILEDFDGVSIKSLLDNKKIFDIKSFLEISAKIAETLGSIHVRGVIHRDIKPHNILINQKTGVVKITDFGISTILTHENDEIYNPDFIVGTMAYMSPEQTGRMNRTVDYRTDLYSFGITLYEMLTGSIPFKPHENDPMELIHSHIAVMPESPARLNLGIPMVISDIIMKLLSKNPEERYQNGFGVMADIRECSTQLEEKKKIEAFELGRHDVSNRFIIPQKLFGREKEINVLLSSFEKVTEKARGAAVMVVAGAPGIGKSALVNEIHKPIVAKRGYFISGKYEQFRRDKPYSAIIQAFQVLIRQILSESEERIGIWKRDLQNALRAAGKVITEVIPEVELIIGKQPELPVLGPEESKNRFKFVFEQFTAAFTAKEHPIALFLDDLQWADLASLQMMKNILTSADINYLFLIVSFRDNEIDDSHPVLEFLREAEKNNIPVDRVTLGPLTEKDVKNLITNFLRCSEDKGSKLAGLVRKKTGGNPFFVSQFLHTLYNKKMIVLDGALGWRWDLDEINRMQVTDNMVEMMAEAIGRLSADTREALMICACIGNRFDLETLSSVRGTSINRTLYNLTEAINEGLVSLVGNIYAFHHDRIQEAAYSLVSDTEKSELHYKIGKLALDKATENERQNKLFYIVDQLNLGSKMITGGREREDLTRLNLESGIKAKDSAAYNPSFHYLQTGIDLLDSDSWNSQYDLTLALYTESVEVCYLLGDFQKMNTMADIAIKNAKKVLDKGRIYFNMVNSLKARRDYVGAINMALPMLREFGVKLPENPSRLSVAPALFRTMIRLYGVTTEDLINMHKPEPEDEEGIKLMAMGRILSTLGHAAFFINPNLFALVVMKGINLALKRNQYAEDIPFALTAFGVIRLAAFGDINGAYKLGNMGLKMAEALNLRKMASRVYFVYNMLIRHWKELLMNSIEPGLEGFRIGKETGDLEYAAWNLHIYAAVAPTAGVELSEVERELSRQNKIIYEMNQDSVGTMNSVEWQFILCLLDRTDDPLRIKGEVFDEDEAVPKWINEKNRPALAVFYNLNLFLQFIFNEYSPPLKYSSNYSKYSDCLMGSPPYVYFNLFDSFASLYSLSKVSWLTRRIYLMRVRINRRKLKKWARYSPTNKLQLYYAVNALWEMVVGKNIGRALAKAELLIKTSRDHNDIMIEAVANEMTGRYIISLGEDELANACLRSSFRGELAGDSISSYKNGLVNKYITASYNCYARWGATGKLKQLRKNYPNILSFLEPLHEKADDIFTTTTSRSTMMSLDISSVMKASQTIAGEIVLGNLLSKMIKIVMENAGAQKGFMILEDRDRFLVEAEGSIARKEVTVLESIPIESHKGLSAAIVNYVARTKETLILNDAASEGEFIDDPYVVLNKPKSILCLAVLNRGKLSGILYLENNLATGAFTSERIEILNVFSSQIAVSIDNSRLFELATTDGLTKLYVHRYFQLLLDKEMQRSLRHNKSFALIMMDIDNFKFFNDTYGHQLGDKVLRIIARTIKKTSRADDVAARYGGEEFVMILPETDVAQAMIAAEKIRAMVESLEIMHGEERLHVTISLGVAAYPLHTREKEELIRLADAALYTSKHNGKNRVSMFAK
jgi:diguanylate cyclase (GGDEF)-like protein